MSKIAVLGDTHFGARSDNLIFHKHFERFFRDVFFPTLKQRGITNIIQLGDLWDRRKYVSFTTLHEARRYFFQPLRDYGLHMTTLLGNHDVVYRDHLDINSSMMLLDGFSDVVDIVGEPTNKTIGELEATFIPWLCKSNEQQAEDVISQSGKRICFGHFELKNFEAFRGHKIDHGYDHGHLSHFDLVISGHYHHRSKNFNILYAGTPYEITWMDHGDPKGFHILDTETLEVEFIENPHQMFVNINVEMADQIDQLQIEDRIVRLVVDGDYNESLDYIITKIQQRRPYEFKVIDDLQLTVDNVTVDVFDQDIAPDMLGMVDGYVDATTTNVDKEKIKQLIRTLFVEAQSLEV